MRSEDEVLEKIKFLQGDLFDREQALKDLREVQEWRARIPNRISDDEKAIEAYRQRLKAIMEEGSEAAQALFH